MPDVKGCIVTFATALVNRTSVPAFLARSSLIRKALVTVGLAGALTAGAVAFPGTASAQEPPSHTSLVASASQPLPTWCPFGTYGGKGGACRGGSIVKHDRLEKCAEGAFTGGASGAGLAAAFFGPEAAPNGAYVGAATGCVWAAR